MDWDNKFYSIVKETQDNLAKAKEKLSGKSINTNDDLSHGIVTTDNPYSNHHQQNITLIPLPDSSDLIMSADRTVQTLHLQEQINYQNRTIEKLQKLVVSLNNEREFYKEQLSQLKDDVERLTDKMSGQFVAASSERHVSKMKRELMYEIEKVKAMLQNYTEEASNAKRSSQSSSWNDDFWTMKENLTESLEQVHREVNAMNTRLDKLESQKMNEQCDKPRLTSLSKSINDTSHYQKQLLLYTPTYKGTEGTSSLDLQQLRQTVNSLNSKLDGVERKLDVATSKMPPLYSQSWSGHPRHTYIPTSRTTSTLDIDHDDLHSLSDLSDISDLSDNNTDDNIEALTFDLRDGTTSKRRTKNRRSVYKSGTPKTEKLVLSLSDSDIDDIDIETDSLDLDT